MIFTREDILKIQNALLQLGRKDSEFKDANVPLNSDDEIAILQDGINKKVSINNLLSTLGLLKKDDFINVSDRYDEYYIQLSEAITIIANNKRKKGLVITFQNLQGDWKIFQFDGELNNFSNTNYWKDLFDFKYPIVNSVLPDEEDLTLTLPNEDNNSFIKLKDKEYDSTNFSGMGTKIIRKNIIEITQDDGTIKRINYLSQDAFNSENTIYIIKYDFTLNENITIPKNCILEFDGGSVSRGTIVGNDTEIKKFNGFEIENENSTKYSGTFINYETFVYNSIIDAIKYIHFPGQNISTRCYASVHDKGAANYIVLSASQCANENVYFMGYWHDTTVAGGSGLYTKASSRNDLWFRLIPTNSINLSLFGIVSDANYKHTDGLYYKDKEHTIEATDNYNAFQAAIGQIEWWGVGILPKTMVLSGRIVINTPIHLYHGSYDFSLIGDGFDKSEITTNRNIECLIYNAYDEEHISDLTSLSCYINRINFNGNNLASDCFVLKNGYERDNIAECAFNNAINNGIRLWGISSTFKLTNITAFDNGKYGVFLCENWNHNGIDYSSHFEGLASLYEISGDNNFALIGVDISESYGASINIQSVKIEETRNVGLLEKNGCGVHIKNLSSAVDLCITNAFMDTLENLPFIVYEDNRGNENRGTIKLFSVFNNNTSSYSTTIIKDTILNKTIEFHSRGNAPVSLIYTNDFDNSTFAHGLPLYRNGIYAGGIGEDYYINTENINLENKYPVGFRTQINDKALPVVDACGKIGFLNKQKGIIDSEGNILSKKLTATFNPADDQYTQRGWFVYDPTPVLFTIKSSGFIGIISVYVCEGDTPVKLLTEFTIKNTDTTYSKYIILPPQSNGYLMFYRRGITTAGDITVTLYKYSPIKELLSDISNSIINTSFNHIGSTSERPPFNGQFNTVRNSISGFQYFDTTLKKPIWWNGTEWVDATGTQV